MYWPGHRLSTLTTHSTRNQQATLSCFIRTLTPADATQNNITYVGTFNSNNNNEQWDTLITKPR